MFDRDRVFYERDWHGTCLLWSNVSFGVNALIFYTELTVVDDFRFFRRSRFCNGSLRYFFIGAPKVIGTPIGAENPAITQL